MVRTIFLTAGIAISMAACAPQGNVSTTSSGAVDSLSANDSMSLANQAVAQDVANQLGNPSLSVTPVAGNNNAINLNIGGVTLPVEFSNDGKFSLVLGGVPLTMNDLKDEAKMEQIISHLLFDSGPQKSLKAQPKIFESLLPIFYRLIIDALLNYVNSQTGIALPNPIANTPVTTPAVPATGNVLVDSVFQLISGLFK